MSTPAATPLPRRNRLLSSCAVAVIATMTAHAPLRAQVAPISGGFQGTVQPGSTGATVSTPTGTSTLVTVDAPRAIINWTPSDNRTGTSEAIDFLPAGRTADFVNSSNRFGQDYVVLNRILPADQSRVAAFNGTVRSTLSSVAGGARGGQVWFYSPGGILVGSTGMMDVGSLLLTANDPAGNDADRSAFLNVQNSTFNFGPAGSASAVEVQGTINAGSRNAYVALIAPRVVQSGNVTVNGSAAYVAAEAATMTISGSLFDIEVKTGSAFGGSRSEDAALVHDGTTTIQNNEVGYGETGYGTAPTARTAIMVAVPKNDAVTMLVQGNIAYQQATDVEQVDGRIILSGGKNVRYNADFSAHEFEDVPGAPGKADIRIENGAAPSRFGASVEAFATGSATATATRVGTGDGRDLEFASFVDLRGGTGAALVAGEGSSVLVGRSIGLGSTGNESAPDARTSIIARAGATIDITETADLDNSALGDQAADGNGETIGGGRAAEILAEGGRINIGGDAYVNADSEGGGEFDSALGGNATGGTATIAASGGGAINLTGSAFVSARGEGGFGTDGGDGTGGTASVSANGGTVTVGGSLSVDASGRGGGSFESGYGDGSFGDGYGGTVSLGVTTVGTNVGRITAGDVALYATGSSGFGEEASGAGGGGGSGGTVTVTVDGTLETDFLYLGAEGFGGDGDDAFGAGLAKAGGNGTGGTISVEFKSGKTTIEELEATSGGYGGYGGDAAGPGDGGAGGTGTGGTIEIRSTGGSATFGSVDLDTEGEGGDGGRGADGSGTGPGGKGGDGGLGVGGKIVIAVSNGGSLGIPADNFDADGDGGHGGDGGASPSATGGAGGRGGDARGGSIAIDARDAALSIASNESDEAGGTFFETTEFFADAYGGQGGQGGDGQQAGAGGNGGNAQGGTVAFGMAGSAALTQVNAGLALGSSAYGGTGGSGGYGTATGAVGGMGGSASGGAIMLDFSAGGVTIDNFSVVSQGLGGYGGDGFETGYGGSASAGGAGGAGTGGKITLNVTAGRTTLGPDTYFQVGGSGGSGGISDNLRGGDGGLGTGGIITVAASGTGEINAPGLSLFADATGGSGGDGGDGATGGNGGQGGNATGGTARLLLSEQGKFNASASEGPSLGLYATALGGFGGSGGDGSNSGDTGGRGGNGGSGTGGTAGISLAGGTATIGGLTLEANAEGGSAGNGGISADQQTAAAGTGGNGTGGTLRIDVADHAGGSAGVLKAGSTNLLSSGTGGLGAAAGSGSAGTIGIFDTARAPSGSLELASLTAVAGGLGNVNPVGFQLVTDTGRIAILGSATIDVDNDASITGIGTGSVAAGGNFSIFAGGTIRLAQDAGISSALIAAQNVYLFAGGSILGATASILGRDSISASGVEVSLGDLATTNPALGSESSNGIRVSASGAAFIRSASSASTIDVEAGSLTGGLLKAARSVFVNVSNESGAPGAIDIAGAEAGTTVELFATGTIDADSLKAGTDIAVSTPGNVTIGSAQAGDDIRVLSSGGSVSIASATTTGSSDTESGYGSDAGSNIYVEARNDARLDNGATPGVISLVSSAGSVRSAGLIDARRLDVSSALDIALTDVLVDEALFLDAGYGSIRGRDFESGGGITLLARDAIDVAGATAQGDIIAQAQTVSLGEANAMRSPAGGGGNISVSAAGAVTIGRAEAADFVSLLANGSVSAGTILAGTDIAVDAGSIMLADGTAGRDILLDATGAINVAKAQAGDDFMANGGSFTGGTIVTTGLGEDVSETGYGGGPGDGSNILVGSASSIRLDNGNAPGRIRLDAQNGRIDSAGLLKARQLDASATGDIALNDVDVITSLALSTNGGSISGRNFESDGGITLAASEAVTLTGAATAAGNIKADAKTVAMQAARAGGDVTLTGSGNVSVQEARAGDDISVSAGGTALVGAAAAPGTGTDNEGDGFNIRVRAVGNVTFGSADTVGNLELVSEQGGVLRLVAGDTSLIKAGRNVLVSSAADLNLPSVQAGNDILLTSKGAVGAASLTAGRDIRLASGTNMVVGTAQAGDDFDAQAGGAFTGTNVVTTGLGSDAEGGTGSGTVALAANDGSNIKVNANGAIALATGTAAGSISLASSQGSIASSSALTAGGSILGNAATTLTLAQAKAGQSVDLDAGGALEAARIEAGGGVSLTSTGGAVLVSQDLKSGQPVDASGRSVTLNAQGALAVRSATATAGNVALASAGNLQVERADASGEVTASSGGTLGLTGQVNGTQISLASRDIAIGSGAQVGTTQRTTGIQITANGAGTPVVIGGSASGSGYRLDNAEFARLGARDVRISSQGEAASMQIDALTVRGAGASSPNVTGQLSFAAGGDVEMTGKLSFDNASDANSIRVSAGRGFFADAAGAGIAITNGSALAGSVEIDARSIVVASRTAATELGSLTDIDDRNDRLGQNDGTADNGGFIRAGSIRLSASEKIHVQNSGADSDDPDDRAGLTAGAGGITLVTNSSSTPVEIIINGRQANPAGGEFTGEALIEELTIVGVDGGPANFAARSTVNGCLITGSNCGVPIFGESPFTFAKDLIEELEEEEEDDEEEGEDSSQPPRIGFNRLIDMEGSAFVPVIDEPVTGAGNEDLATGAFGGFTEEDLDRQSDVDQPVTGTGNEALQSGNAPLIQLPPPQQQDQPQDANGPVTGAGNETLQSDPPQED